MYHVALSIVKKLKCHKVTVVNMSNIYLQKSIFNFTREKVIFRPKSSNEK